MKFLSKFKLNMNPDRMRYQKNNLSFLLCIIALLIDILSLSSLFGYPEKINVDFRCGVDIVCHILFLMMCFMIAEKTKRYFKQWAYIAYSAGAFQILRIFIFVIPYKNQGIMTGGIFTLNLIYMLLSCVCLVGAGALCHIRATILNRHIKSLQSEVAV